MTIDVVIPTIGRSSLDALLRALDANAAVPGRVIVVDDRRDRSNPLPIPAGCTLPIVVHQTNRRHGPAAARNIGWRSAQADWVAFLDDDVVPDHNWVRDLIVDLDRCASDPRTGAVQGRVVVPLPDHRRPTNWERDVAGLAGARYITADICYRRSVLDRIGGFDEHFELAYREDADLALRARDVGVRIVTGTRQVAHPVGPADWFMAVRKQRGNAADARMRAKHGKAWRSRARAPRGRLALHAITVVSMLAAVGGSMWSRRVARFAFAAWIALVAQFTWARIRPGPRTRREIATMVSTSVLIPPAALWHRLRGEWKERRRPRAVLLDRDGTLVVDVPYNGDPDLARPLPGAAAAIARLRAHGMRLAVVSNQSGIGRGLITREQADRVNRRIDSLLGPLDGWWYCPHDVDARCPCRKPEPGLVVAAARALGLSPRRCVVIGDTEADLEAARKVGSRAILVPNAATRPEEVARAHFVAPDLEDAVELVLGTRR